MWASTVVHTYYTINKLKNWILRKIISQELNKMQLSLQTIFQVLALSFEAGIDYFLKTSTTYNDYASGT